MQKRGKFLIYQLLPRLFGNLQEHCVPGGTLEKNGSGSFEDIDETVLKELKRLSITHVWYTGVIDHATAGDDGVKGEAGSPYAIRNYYQVNATLSRSDDPMAAYVSLLERTRAAGMVPLMDFVPNHVARCYRCETVCFEDRNYYPGRSYDYDWSDTAKLNYNDHDTWEKMLQILLYWLEKGVGGFRCDMVHLVPVEFWQWALARVKERYPQALFIAEIYSPQLYEAYLTAGFDYLYDKVGLYDTLRNLLQNQVSTTAITANWQALGAHQEQMLNFLENHDEQRLASDFFAGSPLRALPALAVSLLFNRVPFMLYFGQEFGEAGMDQEGFSGRDGRTSIFDYWSVASVRSWLKGVRSGNPMQYLSAAQCETYALYQRWMNLAMTPVFRYGETYDLQHANPHSEVYDPRYHFSFLRGYQGGVELVCANFSPWDAQVTIQIPASAYQYLGLSQTGHSVRVHVQSWNASVVQLSLPSAKFSTKDGSCNGNVQGF